MSIVCLGPIYQWLPTPDLRHQEHLVPPEHPECTPNAIDVDQQRTLLTRVQNILTGYLFQSNQEIDHVPTISCYIGRLCFRMDPQMGRIDRD